MKNQNYKVVGSLENSDLVMKNSFWLGLYPGLTKDNLKYISSILHKFIIEDNRKK